MLANGGITKSWWYMYHKMDEVDCESNIYPNLHVFIYAFGIFPQKAHTFIIYRDILPFAIDRLFFL